jgi:membrane protease YdiL (CAAX protease family)
MNKLPILIGISFLFTEILLKINPLYGFLSYAVVITACLIAISKMEELDKYGKLAVILLILPMVRIAELFVSFDYIWRSFIIYYMLLFFVLTYSSRFKINPGYTLKKIWFLPLVLVIGGVLGVLAGAFSVKNGGFLLVLPIIVFVEEVLFRGMIQNLVREGYGVRASIFLPSIVYVIFSLNYSLPFIGMLFIASLISSVIYHYSKNIFLSMAFSLSFQFFAFILSVISL